MATILHRGPYQHQVRVRIKGYKVQTKTFETHKEALDWAAIIESEMIRNVFVSRTVAEKITLGEALDRYSASISSTKKGWRQEGNRIKALKCHPLGLASRSMASLTTTDFCEYRDNRAKTVKPSTILKELALISHLFNVARKEWGIPVDNIIEDVSKPKVRNERDRMLSAEEEIYIRRACMDSGALALPTIFELAINTGMRKSEILSLRWKHVNLDKQTIFLPDTKNGSSRTVPISTATVAILKAWTKSIDGRVFPQYSNNDSLNHRWDDAKKVAKAYYESDCEELQILPDPEFLDNFHFHDLRHMAITRMAEFIPNPIELGMVTGHKTIKMLARYYHPRAEDIAKKLG